MPDLIRSAQYFKVQVFDKPGEAARMLGFLRDADVNLLAFVGFPRKRRFQLDFVPENPTLFKTVAKRVKWKVQGPKTCFLAEGDDRAGAVADLTAKVAAARINITTIDAVAAGEGHYGAIFWVKPRDVKKAARLLGIG
ncbi:MAG: hypothetical protein ACREI2_11095 [Nitrospiraceae bacterium]